MKVVILCGGLGTRLSEETSLKPKPLVTVGSQPILWHIMNTYSHYGFNEFVLALGYLGEQIKEYFLNYYALNSDFEIDLKSGEIQYLKTPKKDWKIQLINTGKNTFTAGRLKKLESTLKPHGTFALTYGDGVADIDLKKLLEFHRSHKKIATVTAVQPTARFGELAIKENQVSAFKEKPQNGSGWANGGFFFFEPEIFDYIKTDCPLESDPMESLTDNGQLMAYKHAGFWQCMDTLRDRQILEEQWNSGKAPWKVWKETNL